MKLNQLARYLLICMGWIAPIASLVGCSSSPDAVYGSLQGLITDMEGKVIADVEVTANDQTTTSSWQGVYEFDQLPVGEMALAFKADWFDDHRQIVTIEAQAETIKDVTMQYRPLKVVASDREIYQNYNEDFDWQKDTVTLSLVPEPTQRAIGKAIYENNPLFIHGKSQAEEFTPTPQPNLTSTDAENFDFPLPQGVPNQGLQALVLDTIVDAMPSILLAQTQQKDLIWASAVDGYLGRWDATKTLDLVSVGRAIRSQKWGADSGLADQSIVNVYLQDGEIWIKLVFENWVLVGEGITDTDHDGRKEVFAQVDPPHYSTEIYDQLEQDYVNRILDTGGVHAVIEDIKSELYSLYNPQVLASLGQPYTHQSVGALICPTIVLQYSNSVINILLVEPN